MKRTLYYLSLLFTLLIILQSCKETANNELLIPDDDPATEITGQSLTIFFLNDQHGALDNFAKVKYLVDQEKLKRNTLLVCAGDIFSGNPVVDQFSKKGFPMIDLMNQTGFDVAVIGNHEFDYGIDVLNDRMGEATFEWVCANVNMENSGVEQPEPYVTIDLDSLRITFLGLVETFGKPNDIIPNTHPWRVSDISFKRHWDVMPDYENIKTTEQSDLLIALTHLGTSNDLSLAEEFPFIDAVIGGHSHQRVNEVVNDIPVVQAGSNLSYLGKMSLQIENKKISSASVEIIDLSKIDQKDEALATVIEKYNNAPEFDEVVGYAETYHSRAEIGCFYTTALKEYMEVDASFQNGGGIRADIDQGDITALEVYNMDPFNNQSVIFTMTVKEIKDFFRETQAGLHISGISLEQTSNGYMLYDENGTELSDNQSLTIGINDYIPAVYDTYFPLEKAAIQDLTTAEVIINYLKEVNTIDYDNCDRYYQY